MFIVTHPHSKAISLSSFAAVHAVSIGRLGMVKVKKLQGLWKFESIAVFFPYYIEYKLF